MILISHTITQKQISSKQHAQEKTWTMIFTAQQIRILELDKHWPTIWIHPTFTRKLEPRMKPQSVTI